MSDESRQDAAGSEPPLAPPEPGKRTAYLVAVGLLVALPIAYLIVTVGFGGKTATAPSGQPAGGDVEAQIAQARQLIAANPSEVNYINLSLALITGQRYAEGIEACQKALAVNPRSVRALNNLGFAQLMLRRFAEAEANLDKALALDPTFDLARNNLGLLRTERDKVAKLIAGLRASVQATPSFDGYYTLGHQYYTLGRFRESIAVTTQALKLNAKSAEAYNNLCASHNALEQWDRAIRACERAVALKPDFALAKNNLAFAQSKKSKK
jgi:tetratricopeptide (TPR) repeat protein